MKFISLTYCFGFLGHIQKCLIKINYRFGLENKKIHNKNKLSFVNCRAFHAASCGTFVVLKYNVLGEEKMKCKKELIFVYIQEI